MSFDFLSSSTSTGTSNRVVCGEMIIDDRWQSHSNVLLAVVRTGYMRIETESSIYALTPGDVYFVAPNQRYRIIDSKGARVEVILLNLANPAALTQEFVPQNIIRGLTTGSCTHFARVPREGKGYTRLVSDINEVIAAESEKKEFYQILVHGRIYDIFYLLFSAGLIKVHDIESQGKKYRALRKITDYVNTNYCDCVTLDSVAQETGLSRYYVSHLFKELLNTTFVNYLNELRLSKAATLLTTTDTPIIEIAGLAGFNNISNFNRAFKMFYSTTPSKYRKTGKVGE